MGQKTYNLVKPKRASNNWDLRDVIPIVINSVADQKDIYKVAEAGIDLKIQKDQIIKLFNEGYIVEKVIEILNKQQKQDGSD